MYTRAGELAALTWNDVDLQAGTLHVHHALDRSQNKLKTTKELGTRRVPIEPTLLPLLQAMKRGPGRTAARTGSPAFPTVGPLLSSALTC
jgi:integrase